MKQPKLECVDDKIKLSEIVIAINDIDTRGPTEIEPKSAISPSSNGKLVFRYVSDTTISIDLQGSDGVVRSATLSLS